MDLDDSFCSPSDKLKTQLLLTEGPARSTSDEISSFAEPTTCVDTEERELSQGKERDKEKEKIEKYKEREDKDEGLFAFMLSYTLLSSG